jgi:hypothetical protein
VILEIVDIPLPEEAVDAEVRRRMGAAVDRVERRKEKLADDEFYRELAAPIRERNPNWTKIEVARQIAQDLAGDGIPAAKVDTIRKKNLRPLARPEAMPGVGC